jgi:pimeloyl-ACP methyl ester carboxylesterase
MDGPYGHTVTTIYSYRLNTAFAPRPDYEADLAAINKPLLVMVGDQDEAFNAAAFEPVIAAQTDQGRYHIIKGANHLGVVTGPAAISVLKDWLAALP